MPWILYLGAGVLKATGQQAEPAREALKRSLPAKWERVALRPALRRLAELQGIHFFLDRRIDPDATVAGDFPLATLGSLLESIGKDHGFGVSAVDSVIYLGPPESVRRLRTLDRLRNHEVLALPARSRGRLLAETALAWPDLTRPLDLIEQVCREGGVSLHNPELVPHDLWAAQSLPHLPRVTQLTILLAGFDLTFTCDERGIVSLRPLQGRESWEQVYPLAAGRLHLIEPIRQRLPGAVLSVEQDKLRVVGLVEDHEVIRAWLEHGREPADSETPQQEAPAARKVYTLRVVRRPVRAVLQEIERLTEYRFSFDETVLNRAGVSLDQLVTFDVQQVDIDGLMEAILQPGGLTSRRKDQQIVITAAPNRAAPAESR